MQLVPPQPPQTSPNEASSFLNNKSKRIESLSPSNINTPTTRQTPKNKREEDNSINKSQQHNKSNTVSQTLSQQNSQHNQSSEKKEINNSGSQQKGSQQQTLLSTSDTNAQSFVKVNDEISQDRERLIQFNKICEWDNILIIILRLSQTQGNTYHHPWLL